MANQGKRHDRGGDHRVFSVGRPLGLARALMKAGYGTRKQAEQFVLDGRVQVDDKVTLNPRQCVTTGQKILLDGNPLTHLGRRYFAFHKPQGTVCTPKDGPGRRLIQVFWPQDVPGLVAVGRLDGRTSGLMLVTNDRSWCRLINGNQNLEQEFKVQLQGLLGETELDILTAGILLPKLGQFKPKSVQAVEADDKRTVVNIILGEGRVPQIRRVFNTLHHKVLSMQRTRIGDVLLGDLKPGSYRQLIGKEVEHLRGMGSQSSV